MRRRRGVSRRCSRVQRIPPGRRRSPAGYVPGVEATSAADAVFCGGSNRSRSRTTCRVGVGGMSWVLTDRFRVREISGRAGCVPSVPTEPACTGNPDNYEYRAPGRPVPTLCQRQEPHKAFCCAFRNSSSRRCPRSSAGFHGCRYLARSSLLYRLQPLTPSGAAGSISSWHRRRPRRFGDFLFLCTPPWDAVCDAGHTDYRSVLKNEDIGRRQSRGPPL